MKKPNRDRVSRNNAEQAGRKKILSVFMTATGSDVEMFDCSFRPVEPGRKSGGVERDICQHCTIGAANCRALHLNAIRESGTRGEPSVYRCDLGLMFWTCPVFFENKCGGALRGSGYVSDKVNISGVAAKCNGTITPEEFANRVSAFPVCDDEKSVSLAEMLLLCAESVSKGSRRYHEMLRLRSEQAAALSSLIEKYKTKYSHANGAGGAEGSARPAYPADKEHLLIQSLRRGDKTEAENLLNEVLAILIITYADQFKHIQYRALELAVLLIRAGVNPGNGTAVENNTHFLKRIQDAKTVEDLTGTLHGIVENITGQIALFQGIPHASAILKAEHYIRENFTRKISLREISRVAGLSAPYFSTIFKEEMGENFSGYINRLRVEKAGKMLLETELSIGDISGACGFEDQSWFSKIFKAFTGISPGKYRNRGGLQL